MKVHIETETIYYIVNFVVIMVSSYDVFSLHSKITYNSSPSNSGSSSEYTLVIFNSFILFYLRES